MLKNSLSWSALVIALAASFLVSGCKSKVHIIDHISVRPSDNLQVLRVSIVFADTIKAGISGGLPIKNYGLLFIDPYTPDGPFEVGFSLDTSIVNDQGFVNLAPTTVMPNGLPIGLDYGLVQVKAEQPISDRFDLYGYVDVLHGDWLGAAAIFSFIDDQNFPNGLSVSQVFLRDSAGNPGVIASVFGPSISASGTVKRAGGIALFANVRQLLDSGVRGQNLYPDLYAEKTPYLSGPRASEYRRYPAQLQTLGQKFVRAMNRE